MDRPRCIPEVGTSIHALSSPPPPLSLLLTPSRMEWVRNQCCVALALPVFPVGASPLLDDVSGGTQLAAAYAAFERGPPPNRAGGQGLVVELELPEALALVRAHGVCVCFVTSACFRQFLCFAFCGDYFVLVPGLCNMHPASCVPCVAMVVYMANPVVWCSCQGGTFCTLPRVCRLVRWLRT